MGTRVSAPFLSNRQSSIPSATPEATAKLTPPPLTVGPSGNWLPGSVSIDCAGGSALIAQPPYGSMAVGRATHDRTDRALPRVAVVNACQLGGSLRLKSAHRQGSCHHRRL